jgi:hypothetical protein
MSSVFFNSAKNPLKIPLKMVKIQLKNIGVFFNSAKFQLKIQPKNAAIKKVQLKN